MHQGTPFANVLLIAKLGHNSDRPESATAATL
jgi:hypothetical protein